jgi:tRNA dimethylallyltransferase
VKTLVLFGATAVGKTAVLHAIAREKTPPHRALEVVSADSRQVYRGMEIGTAKPTAAERSALTYHGLDLVDPDQPFDLGRFFHYCEQIVPAVHARGNLPVVSGGTAFYLRGYLCGLPESPPASGEVREALNRRVTEEGIAPLREELERVDPRSARRISPNDVYRITRALEIYRTSGRPRSSFREPTRIRTELAVNVAGLFRDREELYDRINRRVDAMFAEGLAEEVEKLYRSGYRPHHPGLRTIGYREFFEFGGEPPWTAAQLETIRERIAGNTRRYARRQEVFFRKLPEVRWIHADDQRALREYITTV